MAQRRRHIRRRSPGTPSPPQSFGRGLTVGRDPVLGREGAELGARLGAEGWACGRLGAEGCALRAGGFEGREGGALGLTLGLVDGDDGWALGRDGAEPPERVDGAVGRADGWLGREGAARVPDPAPVLGRAEGALGLARPEGRCVAPGLGDVEGEGRTIRGSCPPRLGVEGTGSREVDGGVRTGSLLLGVSGVAGRRCSVGRGASWRGASCVGRGASWVGRAVARRTADGASVPGSSL